MSGESWSVSRSWHWQTCRRWTLLKDVLNALPASPESRDRAFGGIVHKGLEAAYVAHANGKHPADDSGTMRAYLMHALRAIQDDDSDVTTRVRNDAARVVSRVLEGLPQPQRAAILGVEKPFTLEYNGRSVRGVLDLALRTGATSLHLRDWKTGKVDTDSEKLEADLQLAIYTWAGVQIWPWATTITVGLYSTSTCSETIRQLDPSTVEFFIERLWGDAADAEEAARAVTAKTVELTHPPRPGEHCARCAFRVYCPVFGEDAALPVRRGVDVVSERARIASALALRG